MSIGITLLGSVQRKLELWIDHQLRFGHWSRRPLILDIVRLSIQPFPREQTLGLVRVPIEMVRSCAFLIVPDLFLMCLLSLIVGLDPLPGCY